MNKPNIKDYLLYLKIEDKILSSGTDWYSYAKDLESYCGDLEEKLDKIIKFSDKQDYDYDQLANAYVDVLNENERLQNLLNCAVEDIDTLKQDFNDYEASYSKIEEEINNKQEIIDKLSDEYKELEEKYNHLNKFNDEVIKERNELKEMYKFKDSNLVGTLNDCIDMLNYAVDDLAALTQTDGETIIKYLSKLVDKDKNNG